MIFTIPTGKRKELRLFQQAVLFALVVMLFCQNVVPADPEIAAISSLAPQSKFGKTTKGTYAYPDWEDLVSGGFLAQVQTNIIQINNIDLVVVGPDSAKSIKDGTPLEKEERNGEYFDFIKVNKPDGRTTIYIVPKNITRDDIHRDTAFKQRKELGKYLSIQLKDVESAKCAFIALELMVRANCIVIGDRAGPDDQRKVFFENSQREFLKRMEALLAGESSYNADSYGGADAENYSHLDYFSWIYLVEYKYLLDCLKRKGGGNLIVIDDGSGYGHFMLSIARLLANKGLLPQVKFIGTDIKIGDMKFPEDAVMSGKYKFMQGHVEWDNVRIDDKEHPAYLRGRNADLVIVNHVLEHLAGNPTEYIKAWLREVQDTLIVSVPFENPDKHQTSLHQTFYSPDVLRKIGKTVQEKLEAECQEGIVVEYTYVNGGVLVFRKKLNSAIGVNTPQLIEDSL